MPSVDRLLTNVRIRLDSASWPTRRELVEFMHEQNQMLVNEMKLSDDGWLLRRFRLTLDGSRRIYDLPADAVGFAGAFLAHTDPDAYSDGRRREVDLTRLEDLNLSAAPDRLGAFSGIGDDTLVSLAFFNEGGAWKAAVMPTDARGTYEIWFELSTVFETMLENKPELLEAFAPLLTIATALDALGSAKWTGLDEPACIAKRAELRPRLEQLEQRFRATFKNTLDSMNQPSTGFRHVFESSPGASRRGRIPW